VDISIDFSQANCDNNIFSLAINQLHTLQNTLKMIGKGFILFKINSSPSAFYIIKPTCISWLVFKLSNYF